MLKSHQAEKLIAQLFDNQPDSVVWFRPILNNISDPKTVVDFEAQYANNAAARMLGVERANVLGARLNVSNLMDKDSVHLIYSQCLEVWQTGEAIEYTYYSPGFDRYFNVQRSKVEGGILSITRDRTKEVKNEIERQEQEKIYRQIIDASADGIIWFKAIRNTENMLTDFAVAHCNRKAVEIGKFPPNVVGKTLLTVLPHLKTNEQFSLHKKVVETGEPVRFETAFHTPDGTEYGWFIVSLTKLGDGVISSFVDISEKKLQEQQMLEQKDLLNSILDASLGAFYTCEAVRDEKGEVVDFRFIHVNQRFNEMSIRPGIDVLGKNLLELFPATRETITMEKLVSVVESGLPQRFEVHFRTGNYEGWYDTSAVKMGDNRVIVTFSNITREKQSALEIERQQGLLNKLLQYSPSSISIVKTIRNGQGEVIDFRNVLLNDLAVKFTGYDKETLLSKSNVEIDPNFLNSKAYQMLVRTLETGEPCYTDYQLPNGKWIEGAASRMDDEHLVCIVTDVTTTKDTERQMKQLLQELKRSNESLEEFSSAASHDLKEPIRKVLFFLNKLKLLKEDALSEEESDILRRIEVAANRMRLLVDDLLEYSHVNKGLREPEQVDLNAKVNLILTDLELMIQEKKATIVVDPLPVIKGNRRQLQQLFQNLISNAIKYHNAGQPPLVQISSRLVRGEDAHQFSVAPEDNGRTFHLVEVSDNGIGFEQEYAEKIFHVFTRLHGNKEYTGSGVGLAIVRKVMDNHRGYVVAKGEPGKGACFSLLFQADL
ncbi:MAG: PAS domain-containing protein [Bacteroidota bacterium]|nr:PAS domain-containing protein [Bacteroidota bacterium]